MHDDRRRPRRAASAGIALGWLAVSGVGCGEDSCVEYCDAVLAADCGDRDQSCAEDCQAFIDGQKKQGFDCEDAFDVYLDCEADQSFTCVRGRTTTAPGACEDELVALDRCLGLEGG